MLKLRWVKLDRICSRIDRQYCEGKYFNWRIEYRKANAYLKCIQVSHIEDENVDLHASQTKRIVVVIPFSEIVNRELFLLASPKYREKEEEKT